jgi:hypothetical protein
MDVRTAVRSLRPARAVLLVLGLLAALLSAALPAAGSAHAAAAAPDRWGFVFMDNPTPPPGYVPDPSRQWGSWTSPSTNPVTVDPLGGGTYLLHFPQIGGPGGVAHVTAVDTNGGFCQLLDWQQNGTVEDVVVSCYGPSGAPQNLPFTAVYSAGSGALPTPVGSYGYIDSTPSGSIVSQYNSTGATNFVSHGGTGVWKASLPNLGLSTFSGNFQATAVNPQQGARCKIGDWAPDSSGQTAIVACFNSAGAPLDTEWTLSYTYQRPIIGFAFPRLFGYQWFNGSLPAATNFNSATASNGISVGGTLYTVSMPVVGVPPDDSQITGFGMDPGYCDLAKPWGRSSGTALILVNCFNPGGKPINSRFFTTYTEGI